jgi:hypothetical protein
MRHFGIYAALQRAGTGNAWWRGTARCERAMGGALLVCAQMQLDVGGQADLEYVMWE